MGHSLQRWQLQHRQVLQRCVAQGTATPPWQGASPNRVEPHNRSGVGQCPCRQPNPAHAALGGCGARVAGSLSARCRAARLCCRKHGGGPQCSLDRPAPCLCCSSGWPARNLPLLPTTCLPWPCHPAACAAPLPALPKLPTPCSHCLAPHALPVALLTLAVLLLCLPRGSPRAPHSLPFPHTP